MERVSNLPDWLPGERIEQVRRLLAEVQITFVSCNYWHNAAPWQVPWRRVADSLILFPVRGVVRVSLDHGTWELHPGEALLLADNVRHHLELMPGVRRLEQIALHCYLTNIWQMPLLGLLDVPVVRLSDSDYWHEELRRLTCLAGHDPMLGSWRAEVLLKSLFAALVESGMEFRWPSATADPRIVAAVNTIQQRFADDLGVRELARTAGLSEAQFRKHFMRQTGRTPRQYLMQQRIQAAARLLTTTALSVKEIACRTGFRSDHYFHRSFREACGATPTEHRWQHRSGGRL